ncbi:MAG: hypothetical protein IMZ46_03605, partial [Acidobacteria bacterium]|nr:hypothetical protein [Acidobacteriota bacterium]
MRPKKPGLRLGLALLDFLTVAAVVAFGWWHYRPLYQKAADAKEQLLAAQDTLQQKQLDATSEELAAAKGHLETAQQNFRSCRSTLRRDPLV